MPRGRDPRDTRRGGLIGVGVRGIASGIGLASESIKGYKESKANKAGTPGSQESGSSSVTPPEQQFNQGRDETSSEAPPSYDQINPSTSSQQYPVDDKKARDDRSPHENAGPAEDNLEEEWQLDAAQDQVDGEGDSSALEKPASKTARDLEDEFLRNHPPPPIGVLRGQLALPVVLPQRRPGDRSRGFIRAYAPLLENCGIDQATWLTFLDIFQRSSAANPWLSAINMAKFATFAIPSPGISLAVGIAIDLFTKATIELQSRERTNDFLAKMNDQFFRPRGLFCLVMIFDPKSSAKVQPVNLLSTIASRSEHSEGIGAIPQKFRTADGTTRNEWEFPEVAPLVFPLLDQLAAQTGAAAVKEQSKVAKGMGFVANYWDKRKTAEYAMQNPDSVLAQVPQGEFSSRYSDPKSSAASGSLISFVSGGKLVPNPTTRSMMAGSPKGRGLIGGIFSVVGQAVRGEEQGSGWKTAEQMYRPPNEFSRNYRGRGGRRGSDRPRRGLISSPVGAARKLLKANVLYLMVVEMPSDEEMAEAQSTAY